jgi:hypothetical protein
MSRKKKGKSWVGERKRTKIKVVVTKRVNEWLKKCKKVLASVKWWKECNAKIFAWEKVMRMRIKRCKDPMGEKECEEREGSRRNVVGDKKVDGILGNGACSEI